MHLRIVTVALFAMLLLHPAYAEKVAVDGDIGFLGEAVLRTTEDGYLIGLADEGRVFFLRHTAGGPYLRFHGQTLVLLDPFRVLTPRENYHFSLDGLEVITAQGDCENRLHVFEIANYSIESGKLSFDNLVQLEDDELQRRVDHFRGFKELAPFLPRSQVGGFSCGAPDFLDRGGFSCAIDRCSVECADGRTPKCSGGQCRCT